MGLNSWTTVKSGAFESAEVFARPPFKSRQFLAVTSLVAALVAGDILALVRLFGRLPFVTLLTIALVMIQVLGNWARALVIHKRLHELYITSGSQIASPGTAIDMALRAASSMSYWGALIPPVVGMTAFLALLQVIMWMK
jgi:hypothetical protein